MRRFTPVELAIATALGGSVLAVAVPAFFRDLHASRLVEPVDGLRRLGVLAVAYGDANGHFPESAPLTPAVPPRGRKEADPPGTWDGPTWKALGFRPVAEDVPHAYAFAFETSPKDAMTSFVAQARGDLDGDGVLSLFEIRGAVRPGEKATLVPGGGPPSPPPMYVEAELE